jgi:hypothetical protein
VKSPPAIDDWLKEPNGIGIIIADGGGQAPAPPANKT